MEFINMGLSTSIVEALTKKGIVTATEIQEECIPKISEGKDVVGQSQTGSGKTFAYGIPALEMIDVKSVKTQVLVVCPTRELACQVCEELRNISEHMGINIVPVFGGSDMKRQTIALRKAHFVVGTPGRIMDHLRRKNLKLNELKMVVLDEADEMLNMGFKEDVETILQDVPKTRQMTMFSATMPKPILQLTKNFMNEPIIVKVSNVSGNQNFVEQFYVSTDRSKKNLAMLELIKSLDAKNSIIFCNTKRMVDELCDFLSENGLKPVCMHGDKRQSERKRILDGIKRNGEGILIGTDVIARGIDINDIDIVFNYDIPNFTEYYIHRIGRTARAGKTGKAFTLINTRMQLAKIKEIERETKNVINEYKINLSNASFEDGGFGDRKERSNFSRSRSGGKSDFGSRGERKPYERRDGGRGFSKDKKEGFGFSDSKSRYLEKSFGDRKPYAKRESSESTGERKPYERKSFGESKPFGDRKPYGERKSFGESKPFGDRKPYAKRESSESTGERKPYERKSFGESKPFGDRKPYERKSFGESKPFGDRKPYEKREGTEATGERKSFGDRKPYAKREGSESTGERKPYERKSFGESKPFGDRKPYEKREGGSGFSKDKKEGASYRDANSKNIERRFNEVSNFEKKPDSFKPSGERKPYERKSSTDRKPYGERKPYGKKENQGEIFARALKRETSGSEKVKKFDSEKRTYTKRKTF